MFFDLYRAEELIDRVDYQIRNGHFDHLLNEKPMTVGTPGSQLITVERASQLAKGRTIELDKEHNTEGQLTDAASVLAMNIPEGLFDAYYQGHGEHPPVGWEKDHWLRMLKKPYKERLVIAGALIAAEIDRIS